MNKSYLRVNIAFILAFMQGTIIENDLHAEGQSTVTVRLHPGYGVPAKGHRVICFHPDSGIMIPQYQMLAFEVQHLGDSLIKVTVEGWLYPPEFFYAMSVGNIIAIEVRLL